MAAVALLDVPVVVALGAVDNVATRIDLPRSGRRFWLGARGAAVRWSSVGADGQALGDGVTVASGTVHLFTVPGCTSYGMSRAASGTSIYVAPVGTDSPSVEIEVVQ